MADAPRTIKKHANRRLYDTESKRYVSLNDIRELICDGVDVEVVDSKSGADITRPVLLQIMAECEQDGRPMVTPATLMSLIRQYGHPLQDVVGPFLEKSVGFFVRQEAVMRRRLANLVPDKDAGKAGRESLAAMRDTLMQILRSKKGE